ncbi:MAG TPA: DmsE family decaheme c-type cytochrome [Vicinamibacterales bacterium]|nr:DmsE family decaheme c-type cytochrome [Vicinamibacterales bacterium]
MFRLTWLALAGLVLLSPAALAQRLPANTMPPSVASKSIPAAQAADYVGADRCESCHKAEFTEFHKTPHASLVTAKGMVSGCEVCHGPGRAHSEGEEQARGDDAKTAAAAKLIFSFHGTARENASRCLTCHTTSESQSNFAHSEHFMHGVSCQDCHATHLVEAADAAAGVKTVKVRSVQAQIFSVPSVGVESAWLQDSLLKKPQPQLCFTCHADVQAKFSLPTHHPVPEGMMKCTDCHQPHGSMNPARLRNVGFEACVKCHVEKRGPFLFEHAAVQVEGCVACHTPHGSVNHMLLVRRETRFLCIQCHVDPFAPNTPHGRLGFQASGDCTRCHVAIHGSNFDVNFLQ